METGRTTYETTPDDEELARLVLGGLIPVSEHHFEPPVVTELPHFYAEAEHDPFIDDLHGFGYGTETPKVEEEPEEPVLTVESARTAVSLAFETDTVVEEDTGPKGGGPGPETDKDKGEHEEGCEGFLCKGCKKDH